MGTINFLTSDFITLAQKPLDVEEYQIDGETDYNEMQIDYDAALANIESEIAKYDDLYYFKISIHYGYYESFQLLIENQLPYLFDDLEERQEAIDEVNKMVKPLLRSCAGLGLVNTFPGWCTGYENRAETLKAIDAAAGEMIREILNTPIDAEPEPEKTEKVA